VYAATCSMVARPRAGSASGLAEDRRSEAVGLGQRRRRFLIAHGGGGRRPRVKTPNASRSHRPSAGSQRSRRSSFGALRELIESRTRTLLTRTPCQSHA
jgi:hypothetical protein